MKKDISKNIVESYPFPIASVYKKFVEQHSSKDKLLMILKAHEYLLHYLNLILLAMNYQAPNDENLHEVFKSMDCLDNKSHLNTFQSLIQSTSLQYSLFDEIKFFFDSHNKFQLQIKEVYEYKYQERNVGPLEFLEHIQKSIVPILNLLSEDEIKPYFDICDTYFSKVFECTDFVKNYIPIWVQEQKDENTYVIRSLKGVDRNFSLQELTTKEKLQKGHVYIYLLVEKRFVSLYPFIVYQDCYYCIRQEMLDTKELFLLQFATSKRLCYSGYMHEVALREHFHIYDELWHKVREKFNVSADEKRIWELSFQHVEDKIKDLKNKNLYNSYLTRRDIENTLESFVDNEDKPLFCITGELGAGKTTLLVETARKLSAQGKNVFFVDPYCTCIEGYLDGLLSCTNFMENLNVSIVLIFDDVEENENPEKFITSITHFAHKYHENVRIILSFSEIFYLYINKHLKRNLFMSIEGKCPLIESQAIHCHISSFPLFRGKNLYSMILNKKLGPVTTYDTFPQNLKGMLVNPSITTIFLQALKNREVPYSLGIRDIMEGFAMNYVNINKKCRETVEKLVEILCDRNKSCLEFDEIIETDQDNFIQDVFDFSSSSAIVELQNKNIINKFNYFVKEGKRVGIYIPATLVRYYLFYRFFALSGKHSDELLSGYLQKIHKERNFTLIGVVYFALIRLADKQYFDRLCTVVRNAGEYNEFARGIVSNIIIFKVRCSSSTIGKGNYVDNFIETLFQTQNQSCLLAVADVAKKLYGEKNYLSAAFLFDKLSDKITEFMEEYDGLSLTLLAAKSYQMAGDVKKSLKFYKKSYKMIKKIEGTQKEIHIYSFLANAHREMSDFEKVGFFLEKISAFQKKIEGTRIEVDYYTNMGFFEEKKGNLDKALEFFELQSDKADDLGEEDKVGEALGNIARIHYRQKNKTKSLESLEEALQIFTEIGDNYKIGETKYTMAKIFKELGNSKKAVIYLLSILDIFETLEQQNILIDVYIKLNDIYEGLGKIEECKIYIEKAIHLLREVGDEKRLAKCFDKSGMLDFKNKNYKSAWDKYLKALEIYKRNHDEKGMANVHNQLGVLYFTQANYEKAHKHYADSLKLYQNQKNAKGAAEVYNNLAVILAHTNKLPKALEALTESCSLYTKINDAKGIATTKGTEALIYKIQGEKSKSLECYLECAAMMEKIKEKRLIGAIYNSVGLLYKEKGDFYKALHYFEKAATIQEEIKDYLGLSASYNNIGLIHDAKNDYDRALQYYNKDLEITEKLGDKKGIATSYNNIAILHYNHRQYARSLWYLEKCITLYEELKDQKMVKKIQERIQYVKEKL